MFFLRERHRVVRRLARWTSLFPGDSLYSRKGVKRFQPIRTQSTNSSIGAASQDIIACKPHQCLSFNVSRCYQLQANPIFVTIFVIIAADSGPTRAGRDAASKSRNHVGNAPANQQDANQAETWDMNVLTKILDDACELQLRSGVSIREAVALAMANQRRLIRMADAIRHCGDEPIHVQMPPASSLDARLPRDREPTIAEIRDAWKECMEQMGRWGETERLGQEGL